MTNQTAIPPGDHPDLVLFNIPVALFRAFPGRPVALRTADPGEAPQLLGPEVPAEVAFLQVTDLTQDLAPLADWGDGLALDLVMADPATELPLLYRCTGLIDRHPVRVTIPLMPGLARAVKLAVSLGFSVRLLGHQPTPDGVTEALQALDGYLHNTTVARPVEPFHSVLLGFLNDSPLGLWSLLEQDPDEIRILDDQGTVSPDQGPASVTTWCDTLVADGAECRGCPYLRPCGGYFKWPQTDYDCAGVKALFAGLRAAADELRQGLADYAATGG
ncbi:hypothetical protein [uncultured Thiodictyon sp.]|uniref:hypothetical protein n=1 Tax=uncultured Thiodictyon sp. TaxID=1846217 RepID=UPI0025EAA89F|nr:hypothetical protein [uncultured Thiodictyon sp.]